VDSKTLAFGGFSVSIPKDWELSGIRLENEETVLTVQDLKSGRLEVRWRDAGWKKAKEEARRTGKPLNKTLMEPEEVSQKFHETMKKKNKGLEIDENTTKTKVDSHKAIVSSWSDENGTGYDAIWYCGVSDRYYYLRYVNSEGEKNIFEDILNSISCHSSLPYTKWQYLDLNLELPRDYSLLTQKAVVGSIIAVFRGRWGTQTKKRGVVSYFRPPPLPPPRRLIVGRWNLIKLGKIEQGKWFRKESESLMGKYVGKGKLEFKQAAITINGHPGFFSLYSVGGGILRHPSAYYAAYAWTCEESNSLYILINPLEPGTDWKKQITSPLEPPNYVQCHEIQEQPAENKAEAGAVAQASRPNQSSETQKDRDTKPNKMIQ